MTLTLIVITGLQLSDSSIAIRVQGARLHVDLKDKVFAFNIGELFYAIGIIGGG
jgi:hypothetical protein